MHGYTEEKTLNVHTQLLSCFTTIHDLGD